MNASSSTSLSERLRLPAVLCALAVFACLMLGRPFAETGLCDDFSYVYSAKHIAETGQIAYVGWAAAMLGWQVYAAAALFHLFGFGFTVARSLTWVSAMGVAFLLQRILRRCGLTERTAAVATLAFTLSPVFLLLSASFMTDIEGLLAIVLCLYCCVRALQAPGSRAAAGWIVAAVGANALLGTCRQVAWLGVLVMTPCALWLLRARRQVVAAGLFVVAVAGVFILFAMHWFHQQPYTMTNAVASGLIPASRIALIVHVLRETGSAYLELPLLLLPVVAGFIPQIARKGRRMGWTAAAVLLLYAVLAFHWRHVHPEYLLQPTIGDWLTVHGYVQSSSPRGFGPVLLPLAAQGLLSLLAIGGVLGFVITLFGNRSPNGAYTPGEASLTWTHVLVLLVPFSLAYAVLLLPFGVTLLFDRYLLELLLLPLIVLSRLYQERISQQLPFASASLVCLVAAFSVCCVHNTFAQMRAEIAMDQQLSSYGMRNETVDFNWSYDGWIEVQRFGHINNPAIRFPANAYVPIAPTVDPACYTPPVLFRYQQPRYGVSYDPNLCSGQAPAPPVSYRTWPTGQLTNLYLVKYTPLNR